VVQGIAEELAGQRGLFLPELGDRRVHIVSAHAHGIAVPYQYEFGSH
jgi:hypothetical protein